MKIGRVANTNVNPVNYKNNNTETSFQEVIDKKASILNTKKINKMISDITESGRKLANKRTIINLLNYKKKIKELLDTALQSGLELNKRGGRTRILKIVENVDKKLIEITDNVLNEEDNKLKILKLVGEIEGMLIDIYA
ncbi:DUF327 family protein [Senegalia massiliensis]|uniref:DUF327 family protein n=1 Tax=Senegalia massiliensis TaxID=1720316 RepID=A0A845QV53_9CLOT|nr:DUF327 family protein [Senegalia massiliensis]